MKSLKAGRCHGGCRNQKRGNLKKPTITTETVGAAAGEMLPGLSLPSWNGTCNTWRAWIT